jgi:hypothetical protein
MYRKRKRKSAHHFKYTPLLRLLLFKPSVQLLILGLVLLGTGLFLFLAPLWRVTPLDVKPVVKISGLTYLQAWSLKRSANRELASGRFNNAVFAWHAAVEHNPSDIIAIKGLVGTLLQGEPSQNQVSMAVTHVQWMMRLMHTNVDSLTTAAALGDRFGLHAWVGEYLARNEDRLTPPLQAAYLRCLIHTRQVTQFPTRWARLSESTKSTMEMQLYRAAYTLGWDPTGDRNEARNLLLEARKNPALGRLALRLLLISSSQVGDVDLYERSLAQLVKEHRDLLADHVVLWKLLVTIGRRNEAKNRAQEFNRDPINAQEVLMLGEGFTYLDLRPQAKGLLQKYTGIYPQAEGLWIAYSNLLIEEQTWDELLTLSLQIRQSVGVRDSLYGYAYYLEGRAAYERKKRELAETLFRKASESDFGNRPLGLATARGLIQLGFANLALPMLQSWQKDQSSTPEYWLLVCMAAYELKRADLLLEAAESGYRLNPDDWNSMNNFAAALLIARLRPEETIRLTVQLIARTPDSLTAKINHSLALVRNGRAREALELLDTVPASPLKETDACSYFMARFEALINLQRWSEARQADARINSRFLFPSQIDWWMQERQKPDLRSTGPSSG